MAGPPAGSGRIHGVSLARLRGILGARRPAPGGTGTLVDLAVADSTLLVPAFGRTAERTPSGACWGRTPFPHMLGSDERVVVAHPVG
jgi:hypothetical protein